MVFHVLPIPHQASPPCPGMLYIKRDFTRQSIAIFHDQKDKKVSLNMTTMLQRQKCRMEHGYKHG